MPDTLDLYESMQLFVMDVDTLWPEQLRMVLFMSLALLSQAA